MSMLAIWNADRRARGWCGAGKSYESFLQYWRHDCPPAVMESLKFGPFPLTFALLPGEDKYIDFMADTESYHMLALESYAASYDKLLQERKQIRLQPIIITGPEGIGRIPRTTP